GLHHLAHHPVGGYHYGGRFRPLFANAGQQVDAAHAGILDLQVAEHQCRALTRHQREPIPCGAGLQHLKAALFKMNRYAVTNLVVVIDNQQSRAGTLQIFTTSLPQAWLSWTATGVYQKTERTDFARGQTLLPSAAAGDLPRSLPRPARPFL